MNVTNQVAPVVPPSRAPKPIDRAPAKRHWNSPSFRDLSRDYLRRETHWAYALELLLFAVITLTSAWPLATAAISLATLRR